MSKKAKSETGSLPNHQKEFISAFNSLAGYHGRHNVWSDFVTMAAISISNTVDERFWIERENIYLDCARKYSKKELEIFSQMTSNTILALEDNPKQDYLGAIFSALELHNEWNGQFFTPYHIAECMAKMNLGDIADTVQNKAVTSICDPCCGAGCLLIGAANAAREMGIDYQKKLLFFAQDIDYIAAMMCYIQLSLLGCQAVIKVGNSLTDPFTAIENTDSTLWLTPMLVMEIGRRQFTA